MPLTADQRATLQLLLERRQSYADIAAVLGGDEEQVRARARAALAALAGADPDRDVSLTDYLLGQADPIGRADAVRHLRQDPTDRELARELGATLQELFPGAVLPRLPGEARPRRASRLRGAPLARVPSGRSRALAVAAIAAVLVVGVVLAVAGVFEGEEGNATGEPEVAATGGTESDQELERVRLVPLGGGDARGQAIFGLASGDQAFVELSIRGLDPAPRDRTYVVWLMLNERQGYPLSPLGVSRDGTFSDRFAIPSAVLPLVARVRFVDVSIAPTRAIARLVQRAIQDQELVLEEPGEVILRGEIAAAAAAE